MKCKLKRLYNAKTEWNRAPDILYNAIKIKINKIFISSNAIVYLQLNKLSNIVDTKMSINEIKNLIKQFDLSMSNPDLSFNQNKIFPNLNSDSCKLIYCLLNAVKPQNILEFGTA